MKLRIRRVLSSLLVFCMVLGMMSMNVSAAGTPEIYVGGRGLTSGQYLTCTSVPTIGNEKPSSGGYAYYDNGTLTLHNYKYSGEGYEYDSTNSQYAVVYYDAGALTVVLEGENELTSTQTRGDGIVVNNETNGSVTIQEASGGGKLALDSKNIGIEAKGDLTVTSGDITVKSPESQALHSANGSVNINGGKVTVEALHNGIFGKTGVTINGGIIDVSAERLGIYSANGKITFNGGEAVIRSTVQGPMYDDGYYALGSEITIGEYVSVQASVSENGSSPEAYDADKRSTYDWIKVAPASASITYIVTFDANGGSVTPASGTTGSDGKLSSLPTPTYTDSAKEFDAWYYSATGGNKVTADTVFTTNTTIYAQWKDKAPTPEIWVGGVGMVSGDYLAQGASVTTTTKPADNYAYYKDGVLTLHNYSYSGAGYHGLAVYCPSALTMELEGANTLTVTGEEEAIIVGGALIIGGNGNLALSGSEESCVYSTALTFQDDCTVTAGSGIYTSGVLSVKDTASVILNGSGDLSAHNIDISGGAVNVTVIDNYGIYAGEDISISGGTVTVKTTAGENYSGAGICSNAGDINITGGTVTVNAEGNGIAAYYNLTISGGTVTVTAGEWGIKAQHKKISVSSNIDVKTTGNSANDSDYYAIYYSTGEGSVTFDKDLTVLASSEPNGTFEAYDVSKNTTYDHVKIGPAAPTPEIWVGGVGMVSGQYLDEAGNVGTTALTDNYAYYNNGVLTLKNYDYKGVGYKYYEAPNTYTGDGYALIHTEKELTIKLEGDNSLIGEEVISEDDLISGMVCEESVTIEGSGALKIEVNGEGIWSAGDALTIESGSFDIDSKYDSLYAADGDLIINGGSIDIDSYYESLCAAEDIIISGGTVNLESSNFYCIYSIFNGVVKVEGGTVIAIASDTAEADGNYWAIYASDTFIYDDTKLDIEVSENPSGTPLVEYNASELAKYDYVKIAPKTVETYNVWVIGTQVTSANASDVLGDDTVSYDAATNTLTVSGDLITSEDVSAIKATTTDVLNIKQTAAVTISNSSSTNATVITENGVVIDADSYDVTLTNNGTTRVIMGAADIETDGNVTITTQGYGAIYTPETFEELNITAGKKIYIESKGFGSSGENTLSGLSDVVLTAEEDITIKSAAGWAVSSGAFTTKSNKGAFTSDGYVYGKSIDIQAKNDVLINGYAQVSNSGTAGSIKSQSGKIAINVPKDYEAAIYNKNWTFESKSGTTLTVDSKETGKGTTRNVESITVKGALTLVNKRGYAAAEDLKIIGEDVLIIGAPAGFTPDAQMRSSDSGAALDYENINGKGYSVFEGETESALTVVAKKSGGEKYSSDMDVNVIKITTKKSSGGGSKKEDSSSDKSSNTVTAPAAVDTVSSAPTGDTSNVWMWFALLLMSGAGIAGFVFVRKKKRA